LTNLPVLSFEIIVSDWNYHLSTFSFRLIRLLRLISLVRPATELLFSFAQEQNLVALGHQTWVFSCPDHVIVVIYAEKLTGLKVCYLL